MNYSVFGKTMENIRNQTNGFLLRDDVDATEFKKDLELVEPLDKPFPDGISKICLP